MLLTVIVVDYMWFVKSERASEHTNGGQNWNGLKQRLYEDWSKNVRHSKVIYLFCFRSTAASGAACHRQIESVAPALTVTAPPTATSAATATRVNQNKATVEGQNRTSSTPTTMAKDQETELWDAIARVRDDDDATTRPTTTQQTTTTATDGDDDSDDVFGSISPASRENSETTFSECVAHLCVLLSSKCSLSPSFSLCLSLAFFSEGLYNNLRCRSCCLVLAEHPGQLSHT